MSNETVHIDISIQIDTEGVIDTGLTVDEWNALPAMERQAIIKANWEAMAESDNGGIRVVTEGAEEA